MVEFIEQRLPQIAALCQSHGVRRLDLFGSAAARTGFNPGTSDIDFFVEFRDTHWHGAFHRYMGLKLALEDLLLRPVDLVEPAAVSSRLFFDVADRNRQTLYEAAP